MPAAAIVAFQPTFGHTTQPLVPKPKDNQDTDSRSGVVDHYWKRGLAGLGYSEGSCLLFGRQAVPLVGRTDDAAVDDDRRMPRLEPQTMPRLGPQNGNKPCWAGENQLSLLGWFLAAWLKMGLPVSCHTTLAAAR